MRWWLALAGLLLMTLAIGAMFAVVVWDANAQESRWRLHFPISCSVASQWQFDLATVRLHSLRFNDSERAYAAIAEAEPSCAMAYWGIAMSRLGREVPGPRPPDDIQAGRRALQSAAKARLADARERAYIAALDQLFGKDDSVPWQERTIAYEGAMGRLAAREPKDLEAIIFYALALNLAVSPADRSFEKQTKAAELLLLALSQEPDHPGLAHYLTYCLSLPAQPKFDAPELQEDRTLSSFESTLTLVGLAGLGAFLVAVWPVWSRPRTP